MKISELRFDYPESLVATEPSENPRIMWASRESGPREVTKDWLLAQFMPGDVLVVNDTKVIPRRVMVRDDFDVLFLKPLENGKWEALFQLRKLQGQSDFELPGGARVTLVEKGRPHIVQTDRTLDDAFFEKYGEPPLPPYIYRARGSQKARAEDLKWYQTAWARQAGSVAAPTASFHFKEHDLERLKSQGVHVVTVTLHVGAGTFLPVTADDLTQHVMHKEWSEVPAAAWETIQTAKRAGRNVWVLGTTATRAVESAAHGLLKSSSGGFLGETDLLIKPGFEFKVVDRLLTNFHQPESTLLALVCAFAGRLHTLQCYHWAISRKFRLFSYGDLSVWPDPVKLAP
ncbi:MAG TPA: S-adenosylmethionine:tRNA ribosyltransferase-isomerase [Bdellovibrionales bacterium]|nr:S-adenosylmethionine:tRNA ribosyltransferase-isomerase [Bdellovibrionales bacterium]